MEVNEVWQVASGAMSDDGSAEPPRNTVTEAIIPSGLIECVALDDASRLYLIAQGGTPATPARR
jgi:hypothetical protein